jgi:Putative peptidoglycan binding domain
MANLTQGSSGPEVRTLQTALNQQLFPRPNLVVDGAFGSKTRTAVVAFQRQAGLVPDGIVGPRTRAALGMPNPGTSFTHVVTLHFRSLTLTAVPFNTILSSTQAVYAPFGIRVDFGSGMSLGLSPEDADRFKQIDGQCKWTAAGEFFDVEQLGGSIPGGGIGVFFVDRFEQALNGCGGHAANRPACIVAKAGTNFCTAHEVCHILLTSSFAPVHINDPTNLMHSVDLQRGAVPTLTQAQVDRVKLSPLCKAI